MTTPSFPILLIEDDANDVFFFERAYQKSGIPNALEVVKDGQSAVDRLSGVGEYADRVAHPLPRLIVLDLNLPVRNGLEVLQWLRAQRGRPYPVVIVLTSSSDPRDIEEAYAAGANSYLVKAGDPNQLGALVELIKTYWLAHNRLPPADARRSA